MFSDPQFWVAVAFIIFLIAVFNPIRKILGTSLDSKILEIKKSIEEAENIKNETQTTLSNIKKRQNEVKSEINNILDNANDKILDLESLAKQKLNDQIVKRELLNKAKIEQITRDANNSIQKMISETAIEASVKLIKDKLNSQEKQNLINQSIKDLGTVLKN
tara:strand:+ start:1530 stop:2015 length:486 start_codon:yes stop_codon:yes gene_type:complete